MAVSNKLLARKYLHTLHSLRGLLDGSIKKTNSLELIKSTGICDNVLYNIDHHASRIQTMDHMKTLLMRVIKLNDWPHYSGSPDYPVGVKGLRRQNGRVSLNYQDRFIHSDNLWSGEYGRRRRELLDLCIEFLEGRE